MKLSRKAFVFGTLTELGFFLLLYAGIHGCSWAGKETADGDSFWALSSLFVGFGGHLPAALLAVLVPGLDRVITLVLLAAVQLGTWTTLWYLWLKRR